MNSKLLILGVLLGLFGCIEPIELDLPEGEEKLVVFSTLTPDSTLSMSIITTRSIQSAAGNTFVSDAEVGIFNEENLLSKLQYFPSGEQGNVEPIYSNNFFNVQSGIPYSLLINVEGFDPITAECLIPEPVVPGEFALDSIKIQESIIDRKLKKVSIVGSLQIEDVADLRNYYHLSSASVVFDWFELVAGDTIYTAEAEIIPNIEIANIEFDNPAFTTLYQQPGFLIDDRFYEDDMRVPFRISFLYNPTFQKLNRVDLELRHCDRGYFEFHRSVARQIAVKDSPFSEPVVIATNVDNGLGYFSGYSSGIGSISLKK